MVILMTGVFLSGISLGQSISPGVLGAGGLSGTKDIPHVDMSIGEVAVSTIASEKNILTQGFLQPFRIAMPCANSVISYYPNPVVDKMVLESSDCDLQVGRIQVVDLFGKISLDTQVNENMVDLRSIGVGVYILRMFTADERAIGSIKIIKITT